MVWFSNVVVTLSMGTIAFPALAGIGGTTPQADLIDVHWRAVELSGMAVPALPDKREAYLVFGSDGRLSGSDGCNRVTGTYKLKGDAVTFGQMASTQMACIDTPEIERRFHGALKGTGHWRIEGGRLQFYGATGKPLAVFEKGPRPVPVAKPSALGGTAWQLVKFQGSDKKAITPDDGSKYTLDFASDGRVAVRLDCNRGSATWKATASDQLELGPLALTRAKCPKESLHDHIVKAWAFIRSFQIKDGHLFLSLMANGGTYEFEPRSQPKGASQIAAGS